MRWQGREVKPERGLKIVTQPRQARALGLSWLQLALVWVRAGRRGRVSLALRFLNPSPPRCPLRVLSTGFSLEEFPSSVLYVAGTPADCPPHPPRASGPHPSSPSLLTGPAWLLAWLLSLRPTLGGQHCPLPLVEQSPSLGPAATLESPLVLINGTVFPATSVF